MRLPELAQQKQCRLRQRHIAIFLDGVGVEEFDAAYRPSRGAAGILFDVFQIDEIVAQF